MKLNNDEIIEKIKSYNDWVSATDLSKLLNVSTRTIRTRIKEINIDEVIIESSYKGYKFKKYPNANKSDKGGIKEEQILFVLRKLIAPSAKLNIYDLADELYVSDTQFARILDNVKEYLEPFDIELNRYRNFIFLERKEKNIRRLIMSIIKNQDNGFLVNDEIDDFVSKEELQEVRDNIQSIFENCGIYINDYGLQTIVLHVVIMIKRYASSSFVDEPVRCMEENKYVLAAKQVKSFLFSKFEIELTDFDLQNLVLMITNNSNDLESKGITDISINTIMDEKYSNMTSEILDKLAENYCLDHFERKFIVNLTLHIKNLIERAKNNTYTPNPLVNKFKEQNALIYDMATFVSNEVKKEAGIEIVDDEIAFIAFHIGYYIENSLNEKSKVNCCFVYADYHMMYLKAVDKIMNNLSDKINMNTIISIKDVDRIPDEIELIISSTGIIRKNEIPVVETNVFISDVDIKNIRLKANSIIQKKKNHKIIKSMSYFINKELFKKDLYADNEFEMIKCLASDCFNKHLVDSSFAQEVIEREKLSSTSFSNSVALPHSLNTNARKSFIYIVSNSKSMKWGNNKVNIIVMIGVNNKDRKAFNDVFGGIVNVLYEKDNVKNLLLCENYDSFINKLFELIENYEE